MKLVRDNIPDIIIKENGIGTKVKTKTLSYAQYIEFLNKKLLEEVQEYNDEYNPEELVDILEVCYAIAEANNISEKELNTMRKHKAQERGTFTKHLALFEVRYGYGSVDPSDKNLDEETSND